MYLSNQCQFVWRIPNNMMLMNDLLLNWKIFGLIFTFISSVCLANTKLPILPVSGLNFIICSVTVWFLSMWITLIGLHKLLQQNKPIDVDLRKMSAATKLKELELQKKDLKPNNDRIKLLTEDIDKYFISKWYSNISKNNNFTTESRVVLEEIINKLLEVQLAVNNKILLHGALNLYLKHLKEFRRTLKRKEKYGAEIVELYRYSHTCSASIKSKEYYIHQLTINLLSHFLNWELWNSLPCHILVSIIARKLTAYILKLISSPELINYFILKLVASDELQTKFQLDKYNKIILEQYFDVVDSANKRVECDEDGGEKEEKIDTICVETQENATKDQTDSVETVENCNNGVVNDGEKLVAVVKPPEIKEVKQKKSIVEKQEKKQPVVEENRSISKPVKIHEPRSTTKTWNDSHDLASISLGHDPLDFLQSSLETGKSASKNSFWEPYSVKSEESVEETSPTNTANILLNEMKHMTTMEGFKSSMKPISDATVHTLHNIKDLQETTVNNALNKIGDFQDEAAGVVEGLLDFGRAGLRKGLRLTGLQDNVENAKAAIASQANKQSKKKVAKLTRSDSQERMSSAESMESIWVNPLQCDSPIFDGQILLEKSKKIELEKLVKGEIEHPLIPFISMDTVGDNESPDPEYEEAADLASTIAKLRSLLQQKSSESTLSTPALSPLPPDDYAQKLLLESENAADFSEVDGMMPSFMKFCAKTTGVFHNTLNTIKTALPGNVPGAGPFSSADRWIFVQTDQSESDLLSRIKKLVSERKDFCTVDTAYEAIDSLDSMQRSTDAFFSTHLQFEDELDDFEVKLPITKALVDILCELLADTNTQFLQEPMVKAVLLLFGVTIEKFVVSETNNLVEYLGTNLFTIPEVTRNETLTLDLNVFIDAILNSFPDYVKHVFGRTTLEKALTLFVSSLQTQKINQDVLLQVFELLSMKLIDESRCQMSPPASA